MPGPVRADGLFFACAKSKVKSTHKGEPPLWNPRKSARLWLGGRDTHVSARLDLFFVQAGPAHSPRAAPQNPSTLCSNGSVHKACRGSSHKRGALPPLLWGAPSGCRGISRASRLREKAASGGVLVWNPKRRAPLRKARAPIRLGWHQTDAAAKPHYTVPNRAEPASSPGRGTRGGVADP
ncbi:hypothetical protein D7Y41_33315 [Anaerotruncus sp. 1XD22-93]|nr:hypothetical protein D7Y41_33315 [Anaerotruncus sp. 1XD22-93]